MMQCQEHLQLQPVTITVPVPGRMDNLSVDVESAKPSAAAPPPIATAKPRRAAATKKQPIVLSSEDEQEASEPELSKTE